MLLIAAALAAPVYPEMYLTSFQQRSLTHDVEDRNDPNLLGGIIEVLAFANLYLVGTKWQYIDVVIMCIIAPVESGCINTNSKNAHIAIEIANGAQYNGELKADTDITQNPYLSFPFYTIVPYSNFQWPMYPKLLRPQSVFV